MIEEPIVGSSSSPFAEFLQALHATDWVRQGYQEYHDHADGKCPFCQQKLPPEFDAQLASCFDDRYERQVQRVSALLQQYKDAMNGILLLTPYFLRKLPPLPVRDLPFIMTMTL